MTIEGFDPNDLAPLVVGWHLLIIALFIGYAWSSRRQP